jgi:nucleotide-binding universal stress UspA family protein
MNNLDAAYAETNSTWTSQHRGTETGCSEARRILVPVSRSQHTRQTLGVALQLARASSGRLVVLHALQLNIVGEERGIGRWKLLHELMIAAESSLTELARSVCEGIPFIVIVSEGPPGEVILHMARTLGVDAIVMGPRRQRGLGWLRRDFVRTVVRQSACPVYVVPPVNGLDTAPTSDDPALQSSSGRADKSNCIADNALPQIVIRRCRS